MPRPRNDQYDDEDDREEPQPRRRPKRDSEAGSGSGLMMILLIGGGALLGILLLCGVGTFLIVRNAKWTPNTEVLAPGQQPSRETHQQIEAKWKQSHAAAGTDQRRALAFLEYWLALIRIDDLDGAYLRTTGAYKARVSREQFGQRVLQLQDRWDPHLPWTFGHNDRPGNQFKFELRRHWLTAAREGDEWKLEEMEIAAWAR